METLVNRTVLATANFVDGGFHVVVDAALGYPTKRGERVVVRIKQHLVRRRQVGPHEEGPFARFQLGVPLILTPLPGEGCHPVVGTGIAQSDQIPVQLFDGAPLFAVSPELPDRHAVTQMPSA